MMEIEMVIWWRWWYECDGDGDADGDGDMMMMVIWWWWWWDDDDTDGGENVDGNCNYNDMCNVSGGATDDCSVYML